ncbi:C4-dicarboxylate ABC transporter permease [candidate division KSB3 bacterium]|uniref:C4-dicarboxylate ABC transporter permease n=1 Tax=candidate division KSB3 bacterium TaxID=2044937 RepID=A0A2G6KJB6_9BACT|nr:MAG: C4-dicarboxylate ABC transporter permease [candidate division KSB3 bacterium]
MRKLKGWQHYVTYFLILAMGIFHLYTAIFGVKEAYLQRMIHLTFVLPLACLLFPAFKKSSTTTIPLYDWILAALSSLPGLYAIVNYDDIAYRIVQVDEVTRPQLLFGILLTVVLLEVTRRVVGWPLAIIGILFTLYMLVGHLLPGVLQGFKFTMPEIIEELYLTDEGILGIPLGVSATFVMIFLILGGFLQESGIGEYFMDVAVAFTGKSRGGPAKIAVMSSGLFGMLSGSAVANVYGTGTFTIPLMIRIGYENYFAGAVEAVASSGGQIMPPIMGASAFIIASFLGVPYKEVMISAFVPAIFFFFAIGMMVHYRAVRLDLRGMKSDEMPDKVAILKKAYLFIPVIALIYMLLVGYTPMWAATIGILATVLVSIPHKKHRMGIKSILDAIIFGGRNVIIVAVACACAGIVVGSVTLTGIGFKFVTAVFTLSSGIPFIALILIMLICIVLGMGLPTVGAYILASALGVPALIKLGFSPMASHLFVFYFAIVSAITPPVALAAYAASSISKASPMTTGFIASRLGFVAYIMPFAFMYDSGFLLQAGINQNLVAVATGALAVIGLAFAFEGFIVRPLRRWEQGILFLGGGLVLFPKVTVKLFGLVLLAVTYLLARRKSPLF